MNKIQFVILAGLLGALVVVAFLFALDFRYRMDSPRVGQGIYVIDSWTGKVRVCAPRLGCVYSGEIGK